MIAPGFRAQVSSETFGGVSIIYSDGKGVETTIALQPNESRTLQGQTFTLDDKRNLTMRPAAQPYDLALSALAAIGPLPERRPGTGKEWRLNPLRFKDGPVTNTITGRISGRAPNLIIVDDPIPPRPRHDPTVDALAFVVDGVTYSVPRASASDRVARDMERAIEDMQRVYLNNWPAIKDFRMTTERSTTRERIPEDLRAAHGALAAICKPEYTSSVKSPLDALALLALTAGTRADEAEKAAAYFDRRAKYGRAEKLYFTGMTLAETHDALEAHEKKIADAEAKVKCRNERAQAYRAEQARLQQILLEAQVSPPAPAPAPAAQNPQDHLAVGQVRQTPCGFNYTIESRAPGMDHWWIKWGHGGKNVSPGTPLRRDALVVPAPPQDRVEAGQYRRLPDGRTYKIERPSDEVMDAWHVQGDTFVGIFAESNIRKHVLTAAPTEDERPIIAGERRRSPGGGAYTVIRKRKHSNDLWAVAYDDGDAFDLLGSIIRRDLLEPAAAPPAEDKDPVAALVADYVKYRAPVAAFGDQRHLAAFFAERYGGNIDVWLQTDVPLRPGQLRGVKVNGRNMIARGSDNLASTSDPVIYEPNVVKGQVRIGRVTRKRYTITSVGSLTCECTYDDSSYCLRTPGDIKLDPIVSG